jgi:hypothetical protein
MKSIRTLALIPLLLAACAPAIPAPEAERTVFPGFDTWRYPGDDVMATWRQNSPYLWIGYYLPSPCHRSESFAGRRETLERMGWGMAVLYVGQQTFDGQTPAEITETTVCSSLLLTEERGAADGRDAVARMAAEGFAPGNVLFLNVERMERIPPEMVDYYRAWIRTVIEDGRFLPGTYAHLSNAAALHTQAERLYRELGVAGTPPFWIAGGSGFTLDTPPESVGYRFARVWQGVLDVNRSWGGRSLMIDENVASSPSPSTQPGRLAN